MRIQVIWMGDWLTFCSGDGGGIGRRPPPETRLGTGVEGAKSDKALASSGIFPAGQRHMLARAVARLVCSVSSICAQ